MEGHSMKPLMTAAATVLTIAAPLHASEESKT